MRVAGGRAAVLIAAITLGCVTPLAHPLRARRGVYTEVAASVLLPSGERGFCYTGCVQGGGALPLPNIPSVSVGYAALVRPNVGVMVGVFGPAAMNQRSGQTEMYAMLQSFLTLQDDHGSVGAGLDVGAGGAALVLGGEWMPWGERRNRVAIGAYARWFVPWRPVDAYWGGRVRTTEFGVRLTLHPVFVQLAHHTQARGVFYYPILIEGLMYSESAEVLTVGFALDGIPRPR